MPWTDALTFAVHLGKLQTATDLLNTGYSPNGPPGFHTTLLHLAVQNHDFPMCKLLIDKGADLDCTDELKQTPLYKCLDNDDDVDILQLFLSSGSRTDSKDIFERTPVHYASSCVRSGVLNSLLNAATGSTSILVNSKDYSGSTALHFLVLANAVEVDAEDLISCVNLLKLYGADPNILDKEHRTALQISLKDSTSDTSVIKAMIDVFPDVALELKDGDGNNILHHLFQWPLFEDTGNFVSDVMDGRHVPRPLLRRLLCDENYEGASPFLLYLANPFSSKDGLQKLLKLGANVNCQDNIGLTPLMWSCKHSLEYAKVCIEHGADSRLYDIFGQGVIFRARNLEDIQLMMGNGADITRCDDWGRSPLCQNMLFADLDCIEYLLQQGADVHNVDIFGATVLHYAAYCNMKEVTELLLSFGADPNIVDVHGHTAADIGQLFKTRSMWYCPGCNELASGTDIPHDHPRCVNYPDDFENETTKTKVRPVSETIKTLDYLLSKDRPEFAENHIVESSVNQFVELIARSVGEIDNRFAVDIIKTGSMSEGTKIELPNEFDYVFVLTEISKQFDIVESSKLCGLVQLKSKVFPPPSSFGCFCDDNGLLILEMVRERIGSLLKRVLQTKDTWVSTKLLYNGIPDTVSPSELQSPVLGFSVVHTGALHKYLHIDIDIAPCVYQKSWLPSGFQMKPNKPWTKDAYRHGCLLLIQPPEEMVEEPGYCRISFSLMESSVLRNASSTVRDAYRILKLLQTDMLCPSVNLKGDGTKQDDCFIDAEKVMKSYWLKTALLHTMDAPIVNQNDDTQERLDVVVKSLERLRLAALDKHLPAYFLHEQNVFTYEDAYISLYTTDFTQELLETSVKEIQALCDVQLSILGKYNESP